MDYLELDSSATQALTELGGAIAIPPVSPKPSIPPSPTAQARPRRRIEATYLLRLAPPLATPHSLATALNLPRVPILQTGTTEHGTASFCQLSQSALLALDTWTTQHAPSQHWTKIRISRAHRDTGALPLLGRDATLPQHRPHAADCASSGSNGLGCEYPVPYFFYGTLADPARLARLFGVAASQLAGLQRAVLLDGRVRVWAGRYKAVVDEVRGRVEGLAYVVASEDEADALRVYEGDNYEVVAAKLAIGGKEVVGRTFRFAGVEEELTG
ncbi:hypothetical protein J1614_006003 [Plenodomus biglobosus]|nr:hypothetical protein J1614_006003 [Plenodomus biglobosus]